MSLQVGDECEVVITGYYPSDDPIEGGYVDNVGNPLKTLSDYVRNSKYHSHVSLAVDPNLIPLGSLINIEGFNDRDGVPVLFYACDIGGMIKGKHVDICCGNEKQTFKVDTDGETRTLKIIGFHALK